MRGTTMLIKGVGGSLPIKGGEQRDHNTSSILPTNSANSYANERKRVICPGKRGE